MTGPSVFNPARLDGFATGSFWTLQLYGGSAGAALEAVA